MKRENLLRCFNRIMKGINGNNSSNSEIIDYAVEKCISIDTIEENYYKYLMLCDEISEYVDEHDLDRIKDAERIKDEFENYIDRDLFEFNSGFLLDFDEFMIVVLKNDLNFDELLIENAKRN